MSAVASLMSYFLLLHFVFGLASPAKLCSSHVHAYYSASHCCAEDGPHTRSDLHWSNRMDPFFHCSSACPEPHFSNRNCCSF